MNLIYHLILMKTLWGKVYFSHFKGEETEAHTLKYLSAQIYTANTTE